MKPVTLHSLGLKILPALVLALLASCGGGGDGNSMGGGSVSASATAPSMFAATLAGSQEVPPNPSTATGSGSLTVDPVTKAFTATITTTGITGTAAHIHNGAAGVSGPIIFPLTETPSGSGKWSTSGTFTDIQLGALNAGNYYFNVHSAAFPNGEIRGQIAPAASAQPTSGGGGY